MLIDSNLKFNNHEMLQFQEDLAAEYKYKPLTADLSSKCRTIYRNHLSKNLPLDGLDVPIYTASGDLICYGYERIVIGDYGAFIEYTQEQANSDIYIIQPGQEYRINDPRYSKNVKYNWLTIEGSDLKIYQQKKTVSYADYKPGKYYISPHEDIVFGFSLNSNSQSAGSIVLNFPIIPQHCGECPLYMNNIFVDDEPTWGSGISHSCPFGADYHGCLVERPSGCPIIVTKESNKNEKE